MSRNHQLFTAGLSCTSMVCLYLSNIYVDQKQIESKFHWSKSKLVIANGHKFNSSANSNEKHQILASSPSTKSPQKWKKSSPTILFLGSGSSTGCPKPLCALLDEFAEQQSSTGSLFSCQVSQMASRGDPRFNKNYRNNPSILISHYNCDDKQNCNDKSLKHVIIDVGKTFREGALRWMPSHNQSLDAIVLTHEHMDAIGGLDDVRGFQKITRTENKGYITQPIPVFLSKKCLEAISKQFHYLVPENSIMNNSPPKDEEKPNGDKNKIKRHVASLNYSVMEPFEPFVAAGLKMIPLPVMHGEDMICMGFAFSLKHELSAIDGDAYKETKNNAISTKPVTNVVYLSDISRMIPTTQKYILEQLPPTDILVVDSLLRERKHPTHFNLNQAISLARALGAKQTYIVGINCDAFKPHDEMNKELSELEDVSVQLAHDGLVIHFANE